MADTCKCGDDGYGPGYCTRKGTCIRAALARRPGGSYTDYELARIAHCAVRALQAAFGQEVSARWEEYYEGDGWRGAALHIKTLREEGATPETAHNRWVAMRRREGWKYGPVKDPARKITPWLVDYQELTESERAKDYIFYYLIRDLDPVGAGS